jgi:chemotaxis protein methyltransferase WspC
MAFGFRRVVDLPQPQKSKHISPPKKPAYSGSRRVAVATRPPEFSTSRPLAASAKPQPAPQPSSLEEAQRLADRGLLPDAIKHCEDHLRREGPSDQAYYLLGLIQDATGKHSEATDAYRKALYLNPNHYEALVHLALLLESQKDVSGAQALNARARRLLQRTAQ